MNTTNADFFENKYRQMADPWDFASSEYEQNRYAAIIKALSIRRYERAFEPACSIGELTVRLASLCHRVEASEISPTAAARARQKCRESGNVNITCQALPEFIPHGTFDLIVLSEVAYYFDQAQLRAIGTALITRLCERGVLLAAHWLGTSSDHRLSGDETHQILGLLPGLTHIAKERHTGFRLDKWERR